MSYQWTTTGPEEHGEDGHLKTEIKKMGEYAVHDDHTVYNRIAFGGVEFFVRWLHNVGAKRMAGGEITKITMDNIGILEEEEEKLLRQELETLDCTVEMEYGLFE